MVANSLALPHPTVNAVLSALAHVWPYVAPVVTLVLGLYLGHRLELRRQKGSERRASEREADDRLRAALEPWVADCLMLKEVIRGTLTEQGLEPAILTADKDYEAGRTKVQMERGGEAFDKLFRRMLRTAYRLRAETHEIFRLYSDDAEVMGGEMAAYWRKQMDGHRGEEARLQVELRGTIQAFMTAIQNHLNS